MPVYLTFDLPVHCLTISLRICLAACTRDAPSLRYLQSAMTNRFHFVLLQSRCNRSLQTCGRKV